MSDDRIEAMSETIERLQKLKDCTEAEMDTLDKLWQLVYPGKTDWEYPGQVYRHVRQQMEEIEVERGKLASKLSGVEVEFSDRTHQPGDKEAGILRGEIRGYCPTIRENEEHQRRRIPHRLEAIERKLDEIGRAVAAVPSKYTEAESREYDETAASKGETDYIRELRTGLECMIADGKLDSAIESGREICALWVDDHKRLHAVIAELERLASEEVPEAVAVEVCHLRAVIDGEDEEKP